MRGDGEPSGRRGPAPGGSAIASRRLASVAVVCLLLSAASIAVGFSPRGYLSNEDSWGPMHAALDVLGTADASRLYETLFFDRHVKMQYPPTSLLPLDGLSRLGLDAPRVLNLLTAGLVAVNALLMASLADALLVRRLGLSGWRRGGVAVLGGAAALACYPVTRGLQLGQIQVWLDVAFTAACLFLVNARPFAAGLTMGLASLVKPQFLPLLVLALVMRRWRLAGGFALAAAAFGLLSLGRYGLHNHVEYLEVLRFISRHGEAFYSNNSVNGVANRLLGNGSNLVWTSDGFAPFHRGVFGATTVAAAIFLALPFLLRPDRADPSGLLVHVCLATLSFVMASPVAWEHHYGRLPAMFVGAVARVARRPAGRQRGACVAMLGAAWVLCACKLDVVVNRLSQTVLNPLQATHLLGATLLLVVLARVLRGRAWDTVAGRFDLGGRLQGDTGLRRFAAE